LEGDEAGLKAWRVDGGVEAKDLAMDPKVQMIGIEIGGTKLQVVLGGPDGEIGRRWRRAVDIAGGAEAIRGHIGVILKEILDGGAPAAVGVGFGGPVDWRTGRICCSHHVEGWSEFPLGEWLAEMTRLPVQVDNDANVAALGEASAGAGQGRDPVFYVTLGSGVGGGCVVGGRIYHGATPGEAELGHVRLTRAGDTVESMCAGWAMDRRVRAFVAAHPESLLARLVGGATRGEAEFLGAALAQGDPDARGLLVATAENLAFGLSHVTHLFHPQTIVIGGGLSKLGEPLRAAVAAALPGFVMDAFAPGPRVVLAGRGEDAVPVGALRLAAGAVVGVAGVGGGERVPRE
jgi:glucokinase